MNSNESVQFLLRLVQEKHTKLIKQLDHFVPVLIGEEKKGKILHAETALANAKDLQNILSAQDIPDWTKRLVNELAAYVGGTHNPSSTFNALIALIPQVKKHKWSFESDSQLAFDFDSIYERYKQESRIPELSYNKRPLRHGVFARCKINLKRSIDDHPISIPAMQAVTSVAIVPPIMAFKPSLASVSRCPGAMALMPPS